MLLKYTLRVVAVLVLLGAACASGCNPLLNEPYVCGSGSGTDNYGCNSWAAGNLVSLVVRNPGGTQVYAKLSSDCSSSVSESTAPYFGAYEAGTSPTWQLVNINPLTFPCLLVTCTAGTVFFDLWIAPGASTLPSNPNPSGVTTCAAGTAGPAGGSGVYSASNLQWCVPSGQVSSSFRTAVPTGSLLTATLLNPSGHSYSLFLLSGASCVTNLFDSSCSIVAESNNIVSSTDALTMSLSGTCASSVCGIVLYCGNIPSTGVCGSLILTWSVSASLVTPTNTAQSIATSSATKSWGITPSSTSSIGSAAGVAASSSNAGAVGGSIGGFLLLLGIVGVCCLIARNNQNQSAPISTQIQQNPVNDGLYQNPVNDGLYEGYTVKRASRIGASFLTIVLWVQLNGTSPLEYTAFEKPVVMLKQDGSVYLTRSQKRVVLNVSSDSSKKGGLVVNMEEVEGEHFARIHPATESSNFEKTRIVDHSNDFWDIWVSNWD